MLWRFSVLDLQQRNYLGSMNFMPNGVPLIHLILIHVSNDCLDNIFRSTGFLVDFPVAWPAWIPEPQPMRLLALDYLKSTVYSDNKRNCLELKGSIRWHICNILDDMHRIIEHTLSWQLLVKSIMELIPRLNLYYSLVETFWIIVIIWWTYSNLLLSRYKISRFKKNNIYKFGNFWSTNFHFI